MERFWVWVMVLGPDECWPWQGSVTKCGYGVLGWEYAHRLAYTAANGSIPDGLHVCHSCDVRKCCNPRHLFVGTNADNMADKVAKGRQSRGVNQSDLTEAEVLEIRRLHSGGLSIRQLGVMFGKSKSQIHRITSRFHWKHL